MVDFFGFELTRKKQEPKKSFAEPDNNDGAISVEAAAVGGLDRYVHVDAKGSASDENKLITKYRYLANISDFEDAIDEITNEVIINTGDVVNINLDKTDLSESIKNKIEAEFKDVLKLYNFINIGYDLFSRWYVDGRIAFHVILDEKNKSDSIKELRYLDPRKLKKIKNVTRKKDQKTGVEVVTQVEDFYIYNDKGFDSKGSYSTTSNTTGIKIHPDSIIFVPSGLVDPKTKSVISYINKAIKPFNQLRQIEDSLVIYRVSRAPERRIFYIDVGGLPPAKAEQHLQKMRAKHKNKISYNPETGEVKDSSKMISMLEDYWLPRRDGKSTEIGTIDGGQQLGELNDVLYFQKKFYKALHVPISRIEPETSFTFGRSGEISRDEVKFSKFNGKLRNKFSMIFTDALAIQAVSKNIITIDEWDTIKNLISYDYEVDNHYAEAKDSEILRDRISNLNDISEHIGKFFSREYIYKEVLKFSDAEIQDMEKQIAEDIKKYGDPDKEESNEELVRKAGKELIENFKEKVNSDRNTD